MTDSSDSRPGRVRVSDLLALLPAHRELRPLVDLVLSTSKVDPDRSWTSSGELGTAGDRLLDTGAIDRRLEGLIRAESQRIAGLHRRAALILIALESGDDGRVVELLLEQGRDEEASRHHEEAEAWYLAAYRRARTANDERAGEGLRLAARAARKAGRSADAATRYEKAWQEALGLGRERDAIVAATGRGNVSVDQGLWVEASTWYRKALDRLSEHGPAQRERWQLLQNLAIVHRRLGEFDQARELLTQAEEEGRLLEDADATVEVGNGWGQLLLAEGDPRGAQLHFERALERATSAKARVVIGVNLAESLLKQGRVLDAGERGREAEREALSARVVEKLPEVYRVLAQVAAARGEPEAFVFLEQALALIREWSLPLYEEALTREAHGDLRIQQGEVDRGQTELAASSRIYRSLGMLEAVDRLRARIAAQPSEDGTVADTEVDSSDEEGERE